MIIPFPCPTNLHHEMNSTGNFQVNYTSSSVQFLHFSSFFSVQPPARFLKRGRLRKRREKSTSFSRLLLRTLFDNKKAGGSIDLDIHVKYTCIMTLKLLYKGVESCHMASRFRTKNFILYYLDIVDVHAICVYNTSNRPAAS